MVRKEPQLVLFTVLTQMAVGAYLIWGIGFLLLPESGIFMNPDFLPILLITIVFTLLIALSAAVLHLGRISQVIFIFKNLRLSWLSREAFFGGAFGIIVILLMLVIRVDWHSNSLGRLLVIIGIVCGIALVNGISRLYMLRTVPAWDNPGTPTSFFTTTILLGWMMNTAIWVVYSTAEGLTDMNSRDFGLMENSGLVIAALVGIQFIIHLLTIIYLFSRGGKALKSIQLSWNCIRGKMIGRWVLAFIGSGLLFWGRVGQIGGSRPKNILILIAGLFLLFSELIGRSIFYGLYQREGF